jgi:hypothetical protein
MKKSQRLLPYGLLFFCLLFSCKDAPPDKNGESAIVEPPEQIISIPQAQMMYRTYSARRAPMIKHYEDSINRRHQDTVKFDVARYVHYDYETIKQYLAYIEQVAEEAGVDISTLRFYFSNYPNQKTFEDGRPVVHPRQNSIVLLPTLRQDGADYGFYTAQNAEGKWVPVLLNGQMQPYKADGMGQTSQTSEQSYAGFMTATTSLSAPPVLFQDTKSTAMNYGGSAPPPDN